MSNQHSRNYGPSAHQSRTRDGGGNGAGRALMIVLIVLALVASVLMLFLDSDLWLKIAVIASLWSAFLGIVMVSRYASALKAEQQRTRMLERTHRAEMEQEVSMQQQREAELQNKFDRKLRDHRDDHLDQLRRELTSLRAQLAELSGEALTPEQTSVRARAERVIELEDSSRQQAGQAPTTPTERTVPEPSTPSAAASGERKLPGFSTGSFTAVKWGGSSAEETTQIPMIVDTTDMDPISAEAGYEDPVRGYEPPAPEQENDYLSDYSTDYSDYDDFSYGGEHEARAEENEGSRGRRRADENSGGLTVAELMQRFEQE